MTKPHAGPPRWTGAALGALVLGALFLGAAGFHTQSAQADKATHITDDELELLVDQDGLPWVVRIRMLMDGTATQADVDAAKADILAHFPDAEPVVPVPGQVTAQFVANNYIWPTKTADWSYNPAGKKAGLTGEESVITIAADTWATVGANFHFTGGSITNAGTGACNSSRDGQNTVGWAKQSGPVLATTCTWFLNGTAREFDMQIDPERAWTIGTPTSTDLQSVATHEFGHALGLNHSSDPDAVMFATYKGGTLRRIPNDDDRAGVISLYGTSGVAAAPTPRATEPPAPSKLPLAIHRGANLMVWPGDEIPTVQALGTDPTSAIRVVYGWDAASGNWHRYATNSPVYVNDLPMLKRDQAYWIIAVADTQLTVTFTN